MQLCMAWMSVSALVHSDDDDALCNPVVVVHDHSAHRIGTGSGHHDPAPDHCFICHNLSLRSLLASTSTWCPAVIERAFTTGPTVATGVTLVDATSRSRSAPRLNPRPFV
jgi:hypothetical protein